MSSKAPDLSPGLFAYPGREVTMVAMDGDLTRITWTTRQSAEAAGVKPVRIRTWAHRGKLVPVNPGGTHPRYRALDVLRLEAEMNGRLAVAA
jgi:hypothetical protein